MQNFQRIQSVFAAIAAVCVMMMPLSSYAAYWDWKGKSSGTSYFDDTSCWVKSGTTAFPDSNHNISTGRNNLNLDWDKTITFREETTLAGMLTDDYANVPILFVAEDDEYGIKSSGILSIHSGAEIQIQSGTYRFYYFQIGSSTSAGTLTLNGGKLKATGNYSRIGLSSSGGIVTVKSGASYDNLECSNGNLTIGQTSGASGTLNVAGGNVTVWNTVMLCYNSANLATVNVTDGGVLTAGSVQQVSSGTSSGTVTINGGTLRAYTSNASFLVAHANLHVYVGANGGTFDTDGCNITISEDIENATGEVGTLRFTGGGVATFTGTASHTGGTTIDAGTKLALTTSAKSSLFANGVTVAILSSGVSDGAIVMEITDGGLFTQSDIDDHVTLVGDSTGRYALILTDNGTKVAITDTLAGEYVWNGGASGASWKTAGNWTKNGTAGDWYNSTAAVFENPGDAATVDSDVTAASITFRANATITGTATLSAAEVAVSNGVSVSISGATSGAMEKTGPGTLTLCSSRTEQTTLTDGTLIMTGNGVTLDGARLTLGSTVASPIALRLENGAAIVSAGALNVGTVDGVTASLYSAGDWTANGNFTLGSGVNASGEYLHAGGTLTIGGHVYLGANSASVSSRSLIEVSGGTVNFSARRHIYIGFEGASGSRAEMLVKEDACVAPGMSILIGDKAGGTLTLTNDAYVVTGTYDDAGHITMSSDSNQNGDACVLNLFGGTLETMYIAHGSGAGLATVNFDGGTLKAQRNTTTLISAHNKLDVIVGPKGGTIDSAGASFAIAEGVTGTGGMRFTGGGSVKLNVFPAYSGKTTVELGTTLILPATIAGANLEIAIPDGLVSGIYKVLAITGGGVLMDDILSTATLPPSGNFRFFLNQDKTELWCMYSDNVDAHVWIGGASGSLNDAANWLSRTVPGSGMVVIASASEAHLTNPDGSYFATTAIVFPTNSAQITISGTALTGIASIANDSVSKVEFENAVAFAEDIDVTQNPGEVKFTGGVTGVKLAHTTDIHGTYTLTVSDNYTEHAGTTVKSDGVYLLPNATFYKHNGDFHLDAGGRAVVKDAKISANATRTLLGTNDGEFKVDGEFLVNGNGATPTHYTGSGAGTFIVDRIRAVQGGCIVPMGNGKTVLGSGGILRGNGYLRVSNNGAHEIGSYADWVMYHNELGSNTDTREFVIYKHASSTWTTLTFDTTDWYDDTVARTITCEAPIGAADAASAEKFRVNVKGIGKFVFANTSNGNIFSGGVTATNSATIEVLPNVCPGQGDVTLLDRSTFRVSQSGSVTIGGNLSLGENANLAFNFTENTAAPVLALAPGKTADLPATVNVKISASEEFYPKYLSFTLTSGIDFSGKTVRLVDPPDWVLSAVVVDGDLVLNVKQKGIVVIIR
ncbi:MAG: hypothetical protein IKR48_10950 [Kiritimatiellae bacterium]|nr:hypothetical protein [Kiritimatiellia bacterium]